MKKAGADQPRSRFPAEVCEPRPGNRHCCCAKPRARCALYQLCTREGSAPPGPCQLPRAPPRLWSPAKGPPPKRLEEAGAWVRLLGLGSLVYQRSVQLCLHVAGWRTLGDTMDVSGAVPSATPPWG